PFAQLVGELDHLRQDR
ncbi:hypothetical protein D018_4524B, partial [Vibrio parahaemolyticus VP2007-007]